MNMNTLIVVADAARARIFRTVSGRNERAPLELDELDSLVHPEARLRESERYAGSFPAGVRPGKVGSGHGLDDHRSAHDAEDRRRFARQIAERTAQRVYEYAGNRVIVVATHALHAPLRSELERELPPEAYVRWELGELTERSPTELLSALEARGAFRP
jgi:protein required for attachment to host cells